MARVVPVPTGNAKSRQKRSPLVRVNGRVAWTIPPVRTKPIAPAIPPAEHANDASRGFVSRIHLWPGAGVIQPARADVANAKSARTGLASVMAICVAVFPVIHARFVKKEPA